MFLLLCCHADTLCTSFLSQSLLGASTSYWFSTTTTLIPSAHVILYSCWLGTTPSTTHSICCSIFGITARTCWILWCWWMEFRPPTWSIDPWSVLSSLSILFLPFFLFLIWWSGDAHTPGYGTHQVMVLACSVAVLKFAFLYLCLHVFSEADTH